MSPTSPGASILMRFPKARFNRDLVEQVLDALFSFDHIWSGQRKGWETLEWREKRIAEIYANRTGIGIQTDWNQTGQAGMIGMRTVGQYFLDLSWHKMKMNLPEHDCVWIAVWMYEGNFEVTELDKVKRVTANFKRLVETLKPTFAAVDNYGENMAKRKGKDPRRFAWGAMYYDAEHVDRIGVDKLRGCAALIKEEWPDDSMWIQTWGNPFIVAKELTQQMEKELGLKSLFGDESLKPAAKPKPKAH